jgi:peptide/nickel transport system substrate-binding protein
MFDITFPYNLAVPLFNNIKSHMPNAICELDSGEGINRHLLVNSHKPPFDNPQIRRAMALSIDRQAFIDTIAQGQGEIGGALQPPPAGLWGMPVDEIKLLPGYGQDVHKNRAEGRQIMQQAGYAPDKTLDIKVTTRNLPFYRDPAILQIDHLKHVYINATLDLVETPQVFPENLAQGLCCRAEPPDERAGPRPSP